MNAWIELVNADGGDEWLRKCEAALAEVQRETLRRAAAMIRAKSHDLYGSPDAAHPSRPGELTGEFYGLLDAADLIDPEVSQ